MAPTIENCVHKVQMLLKLADLVEMPSQYETIREAERMQRFYKERGRMPADWWEFSSFAWEEDNRVTIKYT